MIAAQKKRKRVQKNKSALKNDGTQLTEFTIAEETDSSDTLNDNNDSIGQRKNIKPSYKNLFCDENNFPTLKELEAELQSKWMELKDIKDREIKSRLDELEKFQTLHHLIKDIPILKFLELGGTCEAAYTWIANEANKNSEEDSPAVHNLQSTVKRSVRNRNKKNSSPTISQTFTQDSFIDIGQALRKEKSFGQLFKPFSPKTLSQIVESCNKLIVYKTGKKPRKKR
ncbi:unnamed protein product [Gordionus sp. m RMFG-2023]|uniref:uncharacterized protein LOC135929058 n=1 Tax=Gordionus sp. m RMFG-2023 TaxID=3053472 RepID=UPI0030E046E3